MSKGVDFVLARKMFSEYESPDYAPEGTEEFRKCLHDEEKTVNGIRFTPMEYKSEAVNKGMLRASEYLN